MAFATVADLEARWRALTPEEQALAAVLLDDAAVKLSAWEIDGDEKQAAKLKIVSCDMVKRAMKAGESEMADVEEMTATMGPFGRTLRFSSQVGELYVTKQEKKLLGGGSCAGRILYPSYGVTDDD